MENIFITYIQQGRIRTLSDLKKYYRNIVMKTHPDAVGSDKLVGMYIRYSNFFAEAKRMLDETEARTSAGQVKVPGKKNYRLLFYREFFELERLDKPYAFNKYFTTRTEIVRGRKLSFEYFTKWKPEYAELYSQAQDEYDRIKMEKPAGPEGRYELLFSLTPVFHNILSFHLTGIPFYEKQVKLNFKAVIGQLEKKGFRALIDFIHIILEDIEAGPAVFEPE